MLDTKHRRLMNGPALTASYDGIQHGAHLVPIYQRKWRFRGDWERLEAVGGVDDGESGLWKNYSTFAALPEGCEKVTRSFPHSGRSSRSFLPRRFLTPHSISFIKIYKNITFHPGLVSTGPRLASRRSNFTSIRASHSFWVVVLMLIFRLFCWNCNNKWIKDDL